MSSDGATEIFWGGETRRFKFGIGQFRELQDRINSRRVKIGATLIGPMALVLELRNKNAWPDDVRDVLRIGLSGGGVPAEDAHRLCATYFDDFTTHSFVENTVVAHAALLAGLVGPPAPDNETDGSKKKTT